MVKKEFSESELQGPVGLFDKEDQKSGGKTLESSHNLVQEMAALL
jgi:hypothetical protein